MKSAAGFIFTLIFMFFAINAHADERILSYHSEIIVSAEGGMEVAETIRVRAEGTEIRRGIYRDFPTDYRDRAGNRVRVSFEVVGVMRDGAGEPFHTERKKNGVRVYIGDRDRLIPSGEYTYTIVYRTDRQLAYFVEHDELYWNVTGNGWIFPMDEVSATVRLPDVVPADTVRVEAYTGPFGARGSDYEAWVDEEGLARFSTTRILGSGEGLTIVVAWPKGLVFEPKLADRAAYLLDDNRNVATGLMGLMVLLLYYIAVWSRVGRDPEPGVIIPRYEPPAGYCPAALRFITRMKYDHKTFAAALVGLAVKGVVEVREKKKKYTLTRKDAPDSVEFSASEKAILDNLLRKSGRRMTLCQRQHKRISAAIKAHESALARNYEKAYFNTNKGWVVPGILITMAVIAAGVLATPSDEDIATGLFMLLWLSIWTTGVFFLVRGAVRRWQTEGVSVSAIGATLFAIPFVLGEFLGIYLIVRSLSTLFVVVMLAVIGTNILFYEWLKKPTRTGRALMDRADGFRQYLEMAEKDELQWKHPPKRTPELFERYLPYAMALNVEQHWGEKFAAVFRQLQEERGIAYHPAWYYGDRWDSLRADRFTSSLGSSLSSMISSSSSAPGSSSGGGGGGSSGGGGGGGGGGGW